MVSPLFRSTLLALAAAAAAFAPTLLAQEAPSSSDQPVRSDVVHSDAQDRHLAPHDTFYTMEYASVRTDKGVEGFPPGTEVHLVSVNREARTLTVTNGRADIELPPGKLTNDLDIAAAVRAQDAANQERVARYQQAEAAAYQKYQSDVAEYTAKDLEKRQQAIREANEQRAERAADSAGSQTTAVDTSASYNNGYYNQGGYGYGSPYGYLLDPGVVVNGAQNTNNTRTAPTTANGSNARGAISSSQNGTQSGNARTGGATSGTSSSTTGGGTGAGKGPK